MTDRFSLLPEELQDLIYEFDPTHKERFALVLRDIRVSANILHRLECILISPWYDTWYVSRQLRRISKASRKRELKNACRFARCSSWVGKRTTKSRLVSLLFLVILER